MSCWRCWPNGRAGCRSTGWCASASPSLRACCRRDSCAPTNCRGMRRSATFLSPARIAPTSSTFRCEEAATGDCTRPWGTSDASGPPCSADASCPARSWTSSCESEATPRTGTGTDSDSGCLRLRALPRIPKPSCSKDSTRASRSAAGTTVARRRPRRSSRTPPTAPAHRSQDRGTPRVVPAWMNPRLYTRAFAAPRNTMFTCIGHP
jgi:hypothetical protein